MTEQPKYTVRGLTLWQPMAWAIYAGHKMIENRTWKPHPAVTHLAIHAGARYHRPHAEQIHDYLGIDVPARKDLVFGAIICVAELAGCIEESDDPWFSGPYGWRLANVRPLEAPMHRPGALGLWPLAPAEQEEIFRQLSFEKP